MAGSPADSMTTKKSDCRRIVLLDDHPIVMEGVRAILSMRKDLEVVYCATTPAEMLDWLGRDAADLLILDLCLGLRDGLDFLKTVKCVDPTMRILVFSMSDEADYGARVIAAGASGYVMKDNATKELIAAIDCILSGKKYSKSLTLHRKFTTGDTGALSDRELSIFSMLGRGLTTREIAAGLNLSIKTVEKHRENIKLKLGITNTTRLVSEAARWVLRSESHTSG